MCLFVSALKDEEVVGVFRFDNKESLDSEFFDLIYENGYTLKKITENDYESYDFGEEKSIESIRICY